MRRQLVALVLALPGTAAAQTPAPPAAAGPVVLAEQRADVDGDGEADLVRVEDDGRLTVLATHGAPARAELAAGGPPRSAGLVVQRYGRRAVIVAELALASGARRAHAFEWAGGRLVPLWSGAVAAQGRDGEWSVHLEATDQGLLRYQRSPAVARCDGAPTFLFPEKFDFAAQPPDFRPVNPPLQLAATGPALVASRSAVPPGLAAAARPAAFRFVQASTQADAVSAGQLTIPVELEDGDPATAWREGLGGFGRGEFLTARRQVDEPFRIQAVRVVPGDAGSLDAFRAGNRLKEIGLVTEQATYMVRFPVDPLADAGRFDEPYWITLPEPIASRCLSIVIGEVYPGGAARQGRRGDTAIAEAAVLTELEAAPEGVAAALAARVARGGPEGESAESLLAGLGASAATALIAEAGRQDDAAALRRLRRALARVGHPSGAQELARGLAADGSSEADRAAYAAALARIGPPAVAPLAALLADDRAGHEARAAAADLLGNMGAPEARAALLGLAGRGSRAVRKEVARALRQPEALPDLVAAARAAAAAGDEGREADLWRAAAEAARLAPAGGARAAAVAALAARLGEVASYELRYRLLAGAGALPEAEAIAAVAAALRQLARSDETDALRRVAIGALARNPAAGALPLLTAAAADPDPGVRLLAVAGLGERGGEDAAAETALTGALGADVWPQVRRAAAGALAPRCRRPRPAEALYTAVAKDADLEVRRGALGSLVACRHPGIGDRLIAIARDRRLPPDLRTHAANLIAELADRALVPALVEVLRGARGEAWASTAGVRVASAAAVALGRLGDPRAAAVLLETADDDSFPEIQAAAVTALGQLCPPGAAAVVARAAKSAHRLVVIAARSARTRCSG